MITNSTKTKYILMAVAAVFFSVNAAADLPAEEHASGIVSCWKFEENGGDVAFDTAGSNHGMLVNGTRRDAGIVGGAVGFDGEDDGVSLEQTFLFHTPGDATLIFWMNREDDVHRSIFWTRGNDDDANRYNIFSGDLSWGGTGNGFGIDYREENGTLHTLYAVPFPANQWAQIAVTRSGNTYDLYKNGQHVAQTTDTWSSLPTYVGAWYMGYRGGYVYKGLIDEVALYKRALAPQEIADRYAYGLNGQGCETDISAEVKIDIKPGSFPNSINPMSRGNVPVAILGSQTFDASVIDAESVTFSGASPRSFSGAEDVNGDGFPDAVFHFATKELLLQAGDTVACVNGMTTGGRKFTGCDSVRILQK